MTSPQNKIKNTLFVDFESIPEPSSIQSAAEKGITQTENAHPRSKQKTATRDYQLKVSKSAMPEFTKIEYVLEKTTVIMLTVQDAFGIKMKLLVDNLVQNKGAYKIIFKNDILGNGTYFVLLKAGNYREFKKIILSD